jgi:hypothetical protein
VSLPNTLLPAPQPKRGYNNSFSLGARNDATLDWPEEKKKEKEEEEEWEEEEDDEDDDLGRVLIF